MLSLKLPKAPETGFIQSQILNKTCQQKIFSLKNRNVLVEGEIGCGGFGKIFEVSDVDDPKTKYALKIIPTKTYGIPCLSEVVIGSVLQHPNLINVVDYAVNSKEVQILFPLADNSLDKTDICDDDCLINLVYQIIKALMFIHSMGLVHNDVKPHNILKIGDVVKLADFGLTKFQNCKTEEHFGTIYFESPELIMENKVTSSNDFWSLGVTLFKLKYKKYPFTIQDGDREQVIYKQLAAINNWFSKVDNINGKRKINKIMKYLRKESKAGKIKGRLKFKKIELPEEWHLSKNTKINELILKLMNHNPSKRSSGYFFINLPIFSSLRSTPSDTFHHSNTKFLTPTNFLDVMTTFCTTIVNKNQSLLKINRWSRQYLNKIIYSVSRLIYLKFFTNELGKIFDGGDVELYEILEMERFICFHSGFRLPIFCVCNKSGILPE